MLSTVLNHQNIRNHLERISKIRPFINSYNWKEISFPSHIKIWKKFESNNKSIALNIFFTENDTEEITQAYISKHNFNLENKRFLWLLQTVKNGIIIHRSMMVIIIVLTFFIHPELKINSKYTRMPVKS